MGGVSHRLRGRWAPRTRCITQFPEARATLRASASSISRIDPSRGSRLQLAWVMLRMARRCPSNRLWAFRSSDHLSSLRARCCWRSFSAAAEGTTEDRGPMQPPAHRREVEPVARDPAERPARPAAPQGRSVQQGRRAPPARRAPRDLRAAAAPDREAAAQRAPAERASARSPAPPDALAAAAVA
jgi:hypothetical protein